MARHINELDPDGVMIGVVELIRSRASLLAAVKTALMLRNPHDDGPLIRGRVREQMELTAWMVERAAEPRTEAPAEPGEEGPVDEESSPASEK